MQKSLPPILYVHLDQPWQPRLKVGILLNSRHRNEASRANFYAHKRHLFDLFDVHGV